MQTRQVQDQGQGGQPAPPIQPLLYVNPQRLSEVLSPPYFERLMY
jgi:hypothetical protein